MATTPNYGWPLPDPNVAPDVPSDMQDLGDAIDLEVDRLETVKIAGLQTQLNALEAQALVVLDVVDDVDVSSIEFTSIDQSYDHLLVYWRGDGVGGGYTSLNIRFNGSGAADAYISQRIMFATPSGTWTQGIDFAGGPEFSVLRAGVTGGTSGSAGSFYIPFYSEVTVKSAVGQSVAIRQDSGESVPTMALCGGQWTFSSAAISSLWISPSGVSWERIRAHLIGIRSGT